MISTIIDTDASLRYSVGVPGNVETDVSLLFILDGCECDKFVGTPRRGDISGETGEGGLSMGTRIIMSFSLFLRARADAV